MSSCDFAAGRLLRAYNIEFNWFKLSSWINITEQWPYRLSWIILEVEDNPDIEDPLSLKTVYDRSAIYDSCWRVGMSHYIYCCNPQMSLFTRFRN